MSLKFPVNRKEIADRAKSDVQAELPTSNPFLKNSYLGSLISSFAGRVFDFYLQLKELVKQMFPDTATNDFLVRWGEYVGITRNPATVAEGGYVATGTVASVIPAGTIVQNTDGLQYKTQATKTLTTNTQTLTSLTRSGAEVTAVAPSNHNLASGIEVTIAGATETEYNGTYPIIVISETEFTYEISGTPTSPATGTPQISYDGALLTVKSVATGQSYNLLSGSKLSLFSPIAGVDTDGFVDFGEVAGGTDLESDKDLRARIITRYANPVSLFNVAAIDTQAKKVAGVTRVFIEPITPYVGAVTVYFTRDNDANIIPSASEVNKVKTKILEITPANTDPDDVVVAAPVAITTNFVFTSVSQNTSTMQEAITANLEVLFEENTSVGNDLLEIAYQAAIFQTIDPETGSKVSSFTLSSPSGDITAAAGEIPVLGTVTFS